MEATYDELTGLTWHHIDYGENHHVQMSELFGEESRSAKVYNTFDLFGSYRSDYALKDGRYAVVKTSQYGRTSHVALLPNYEAYRIWERNDGLLDQDPEGRGGRNTVGQKIMWVRLWMRQHPGEAIPTNFNSAPALWHYDYNCPKCREGKELHTC